MELFWRLQRKRGSQQRWVSVARSSLTVTEAAEKSTAAPPGALSAERRVWMAVGLTQAVLKQEVLA